MNYLNRPDIKGDFDHILIMDKIEWTLSETGSYYETVLKYAHNDIPSDISDRYQIMKIYVPAAYIREDGSVNEGGTVGRYNVLSAPVIFKNNCFGWKSSIPREANEDWILKGWIQVECGARSRDADPANIYSKSPCQVVDLKSGLRMMRLNRALIPGDLDRVISFGFSGGGQMSSMLGATGNMEAYYEMLWENGAAGISKKDDGSFISTIDDSVYGCMCFAPIATLQAASSALAWMRYDSSVNGGFHFTPFQLQLEKDMAVGFCEYINSLSLKNDRGELLVFDIDPETNMPDPRKGSYYDQILQNISDALTCFANAGDTIFPYIVRKGFRQTATFTEYQSFRDLYDRYTSAGNAYVQNGTGSWISEKSDGSWSVTDFAGFFHGTELTRFKGIPAFDGFFWSDEENCYCNETGKQTENNAFGEPGIPAVHYSRMVADILQEYYNEYQELEGFDKQTVDRFISEAKAPGLAKQLYLMDSMQIILNVCKGKEKADIAKKWRVRMGTADQNSFAIAYNFAMAAQMNGADVNYHLVWAMPHSTDEGTTTGTFDDWVESLL